MLSFSFNKVKQFTQYKNIYLIIKYLFSFIYNDPKVIGLCNSLYYFLRTKMQF